MNKKCSAHSKIKIVVKLATAMGGLMAKDRKVNRYKSNVLTVTNIPLTYA